MDVENENIQEENQNIEEEDEENNFLNDLNLNDRVNHIVERVKNLDMSSIGEAYKKRETRLVIQKIELQNFKSYQGTAVIGPLYHKFNAVVGPNGSGKSNLMESLLFVFGKKAKSMRLKKLNELIHKSTNYPDLKFARVSVYFNEIKDLPNGHYEEVPKSELILTREVTKNSSSKYYLNKQEISHENLCLTLEKFGIDLKHNRFLILQGEVEHISMLANKAKPNSKDAGGLLEFLEDIIGTSRYVNLINHLTKDTDEILEIRSQYDKRVKICKGEIDKMEDSKNTCIKYYKEEKYLYYLNYLTLKITEIEITRDQITLKDDLKVKEDLKQNKLKELEDLKKKNEKVLSDLNEKKMEQKRVEKLKTIENNKLSALEEEDKVKRGELDMIEKAIKKEDNMKKIIMKSLDEMNEKHLNAKRNLPLVQDEINKTEKEIKSLENNIQILEKESYEKTVSLQKEKQEIEKELSPFINEIQELEFEISQKEKLIGLNDMYDKGLISIKENSENYERVRKDAEQIKTKLNQVVKDDEEILHKIEKYQQEVKNLYNNIQENEKKSNEVISKLNDIQHERKQVEQKSVVIVSLMNAKKTGELKGIRGRLGDLGVIDLKYDIAVSTAAFSQLDSIVVEKVEDAEVCINYLKRHKLGRCTFIIMDKIDKQKQDMKLPFQCPNNTERLFDKVKPSNEEYSPAFYFALRNTLVTKDLESANKAAFGSTRHRVVTLSGELIETSGAMSGGGKPKQGMMSNKKIENDESNKIEIEKMKQLYDNIKQEIDDLNKQKKLLENELNALSLNHHQNKGSIQSLEKNLSLLQKQELDYDKEINHIKSNLKKLEEENKKLKNTRKEINSFKDKILELRKQSSGLSSKLENIVKQINSISGNKVKEAKEKLCTLRNRVAEAKTEKFNYDNLINQAPKEIKNISDNIKAKEESIEELKGQIVIKQDEISQMDVKAEKIMMEIENIEKLITKTKEEFTKLTNENGVFKENVRKINDERLKIDNEITQIKSEINKCTNKLSLNSENQKNQIRNYKKFIDEFSFIDDIMIEINKLNNVSIEESATKERDQKRKRYSEVSKFLSEDIFDKELTEEDKEYLFERKVEIDRLTVSKDIEVKGINPNMTDIRQYKERLIDLKAKESDLKACANQLAKVQDSFNTIKKKRHREFMDGFALINTKLKEMYRVSIYSI